MLMLCMFPDTSLVPSDAISTLHAKQAAANRENSTRVTRDPLPVDDDTVLQTTVGLTPAELYRRISAVSEDTEDCRYLKMVSEMTNDDAKKIMRDEARKALKACVSAHMCSSPLFDLHTSSN